MGYITASFTRDAALDYRIHLGCGVCYFCQKTRSECRCPDPPEILTPPGTRRRQQREKRRLQPPKPTDRVLWPDQVAKYYLDCSRKIVDRKARDGTLPGVMWLAQGQRKGMYKVNRAVFEKALEEGKIGVRNRKGEGKK